MENKDDLVIAFINEILQKEGITQSELARRLKVEQSYINNVIHGRKTVGLDVASKIAKYAKVSIEDIVLPPDERAVTLNEALKVLSAYERAEPSIKKDVRALLGIEKPELSGPDPSDIRPRITPGKVDK